MEFLLVGFCQKENIRHYSFQGIGDDRSGRMEFSVGVDLTLLHKHGIPLQEVPLLCRFLLASQVGHEQLGSLMFSEGEMLAHAEQRARDRAEAQIKRRSTSVRTLATPTSPPSPVLTNSGNGKSGIGLGSRLSFQESAACDSFENYSSK